MKIGIFDSGIGGLSVLYEAMKRYPDASYIYYADKDNVPYGEKTREQILEYVKDIIDFLISKNVDAIVIACNTATSVATKELRSTYPIPIIGMEPAIKKAVDLYAFNHKRILVAATPITITGDKLHNLIDKLDYPNIDLIALPQLVRFAEQGIFEGKEVKDYLYDIFKEYKKEDYSSIVLGCTHFNYFKKELKELFTDINFVDGNNGTITHLFNQIPYTPSSHNLEIYYSKRLLDKEDYKQLIPYFKILEEVYDL